MIPTIEQKYQNILSNIEELYYEVDLAGNLTISNDSMTKILGYSKDELIGMNNRQYMDEETSKKVYQMFSQVYRTGVAAKAFDWELIRKDGTRRILETSVSLMHDSEGRPIGFYGIGRDITDAKRAEEALRAEKQKFQVLSENAPFAMVMIDQDGTFRYINPKFRELFGYDLTDVPSGRAWLKKAYPDSHYRHDVISAWKEDLNSSKPGEKRPRVFTATCKDGSQKIISFISVQLETGENLMACEDITERKQAEKGLHESELRYRNLVENINDMVGEVDDNGQLLYVNRMYKETLGYNPSERVGRSIFENVHPDDRHRVVEAFEGGINRGYTNALFRVKHKNGQWRWIEVFGRRYQIVDGNFRNIVISRDVSERKRAEEALRESEEKYRTILNSIEEGYYEVDLAGNFTFSNDFLVKSLGYTREELQGLNNRQYMTPETAKLVFNTFNEVYRTRISKRDFEWELINKDGTKRFVEVSVFLMHDEKGEPKGFYGIARDITERKQAEEQERNLQRAKDKVLQHLSHELRTPLSVIQGGIRILKRKIQVQAPPIVGGEIFDSLERSLGRLCNIQQEADAIIRSYSEMEKSPHLQAIAVPPSEKVERISLYSFAQKVLAEAKEKASHRDIQITLEGEKDLTLNANPEVLEGMFIGLLKNAIENTPDEGVIRIVLEQKDRRIQLKFMDFGIGVTKEDQRRLFDGLFHTLDTELYRSKKPYDFGAGGKGLDLLRMKVLSKRFGFDITVVSQRCLYLPTDRDLCPGRISKCPYCRVREDCFNSGGSTFCLNFSVAGE